MKDLRDKFNNSGVAIELTVGTSRRIKLQNRFGLLISFFLVIFIVVNLTNNKPLIALVEAITIVLLGLSMYLNHRKKYFASSVLFYVVIFVALILLCFVTSVGRDLEYFFLITGIFPLIFYVSRKLSYFLFILCFVTFVFAKIVAYGWQDVIAYLNYALIFLIGLYAVKYLKQEFETYIATIETQNALLKKLNNEKDHLMSIASHDLRSPLLRMQGLLSLLSLKGSLTSEQSEILELTKTETERQVEMINEVLDLNALNEGTKEIKLETVDAYEMILNLATSFKTLSDKKDITIAIENSEMPYRCLANTMLLTQVFENLLSNAIKYSYPGTQITIAFKTTEKALQISVKDQGQGMDAEDKKMLFRRFQRLSANPTGGENTSGLGLSITKKYVEAMGGVIHCESEKGKGSTFTVTLKKA